MSLLEGVADLCSSRAGVSSMLGIGSSMLLMLMFTLPVSTVLYAVACFCEMFQLKYGEEVVATY